MQFNSFDYMFFFPIVVVVFFLIPKKLRSLWLLAASYYFYMSWNAKYALLIGASTIITYFAGILIEGAQEGEERAKTNIRKTVVVLAILINLSILAIFKYGNFALKTVGDIGRHFNLFYFDKRLDILLPVGISFYTFQALGYVIDVYRGDIRAEHNPVRYALFVSFFPQLVAGPIERSHNLLKQIGGIEGFRLYNAKRVTSGAVLMVWGLFLKMVIADRISIPVDMVFDNFRRYGSTELIFAAAGFSIQIYCDFASYSMLAIGSAKILGFELMENFNTPYFSESIKEFWERWHISLTTWLRDYLYIPLGGNRRGKIRKYINIMLVFLASGLWHGANWTYVFWGGLHGLFRVAGEWSQDLRRGLIKKFGIRSDCFSYHFLKVFITFCLTVFAWIFFRAPSITDALAIVKRIFLKPTPWVMFNGGLYELGLNRTEMNILFISLVVLLLVSLVRRFRGQTVDVFLMGQNLWFEWAVIIVLVMAVFVYGEYGPAFDARQFIYFQF